MPSCVTCHRTGIVGENMHELAELGFGAHDMNRAIHLCGRCLDQRRAENWPVGANESQRIFDALNGKEQAPSRKYSYFLEPEESIQLVRLRPDWVDKHAADA